MADSFSSRLRTRLVELSRLQGVVVVLVRHGFGSVVDRLGVGTERSSSTTTRAAVGRRLALALTDLGPTFVKLGQVLATRDDVLPPEITTELCALHHDGTPVPAAAIRHEVALALGAPVPQWFAAFDDQPLAAASVAQVHRAITLDGREVVCKVRRPGIARQVEEDLALLGTVAELLNERVEEVRRYDPLGLFAEFADALRAELDFVKEADALTQMREVVGNTAMVPTAVPELSSDRVLTMTYLPGQRLSEIEDDALRADIARQILRSFVRQILRGGFFHADPHPGNLLIHEGRLALLDFGSVGRFTSEMRQDLVSVAAAAAERDGARLATAMLPLLADPGPPDRAAYDADVGGFLDRVLGRDVGAVRFRELSQEIWALSRRHELRIRPGYLKLLRTAATLDGVVEQLAPGLDPIREVRGVIVAETVAAGAERAVHTMRRARGPQLGAAIAAAMLATAAALWWWLG